MVSEYLDPKNTTGGLPWFNLFYPETKVGYSDHTIGNFNCIEAVKHHGAKVIEKHFCLKHNEEFKGIVFRDTVHGATPEEFYQLSKAIK